MFKKISLLLDKYLFSNIVKKLKEQVYFILIYMVLYLVYIIL